MRGARHIALLLAALALGAACSDDSSDDDAAAPTTVAATTTTVREGAPAWPSGGCATDGSQGAEGAGTRTFDFGGKEREYEVSIPESYDAATPAPILLNLHGFTSNIAQQNAVSRFPAEAGKRGYIVVTPQGYPTAIPINGQTSTAPYWNIAPAFSAATQDTSPDVEAADDIGFLLALLDDIEGRLCVDTTSQYVSGLSNGASMTSVMICNADERFAAAAPVSGVNIITSCPATHATPVIAFAGDADPLVSYTGGSIFNYDVGLPSAEQRVADFATLGGCDPTPDESQPFDDVKHFVWECPEGMNAELYTVVGGGHSWPGATFPGGADTETTATTGATAANPGSEALGDTSNIAGHQTTNIDATELILDFFDAHHRAGS